MAWMAGWIVLCVLAVAFYARFLMALCRESKFRWICDLLLLQQDTNAYEWPKGRDAKVSFRRAA